MKKIGLALLLFLWVQFFALGQEESRLLRFPAVNGAQIVFTYAGDLYTVAKSGGMARKLTSHEGFEMFAKYSPDGRQLAFTAQYDGNTEVYVMPASGGAPVRLTYTATLGRDDVSDRMGPNNIVMGWSPDGKNIIYRSRKQSFNDFVGQLYTVPALGGMSTEVPLSTGGFCSYSPDGTKLAFNRVFREFRTWKYYQGGMADDIRIFDFNTGNVVNITDHDAQDIFPMWHGDQVYFLSDRDRVMNLFVYNTTNRQTRKLTNYSDYDIKFPSIGQNAIAYEKGGYIYLFDLLTQRDTRVSITIADDFNGGRNELKDAAKSIRFADPSPDGKRVVFSARGEVFSVPSEEGITRNLTETPGAHDREARWSPDGKNIAYLSDQSGEYEIWITAQDGRSEPVQITRDADTYKFSIRWSPDSRKILWSDKKLRLQYVDIDTREVKTVAQSMIWEYNAFSWSPDSRWIAFADQLSNNFNMIRLYDTQTGNTINVTDEWYSSNNPVFSHEGKYLLFTSERDFNPVYGQTEWNHVYLNMSRVYLVLLSKDTPNPLGPKNDEVTLEAEPVNEADGKSKPSMDKKPSAESKPINIDADGLGDRVVSLPLRPSNYFNLYLVDEKVYYNENLAGGDGMTLKMFDLKKKEETELGKGMRYTVSTNGKKMLVAQDQKYSIIDLPSSKITLTKTIDLSGLKVFVDKDQEWRQIFDEAWRQMRDFFYVENMHGVDWPAMKEKYGQMLPYVNNRDDLNYLIGEMIAELNVGHAYVNGGDKPAPERIKTGLLGARISKDTSSGYFRIDRLLKGQNWTNSLRSPLTEVGVNAQVGEYILAVDGKSTREMPDIYAALLDKAGKQVELTLGPQASDEGSRKALVVPVADEADLYYFNWVQKNIDYVNQMTNGEVGYIHIPDMGPAGLNEFAKYFYPQLAKKGLIIDDRGNGGGNVSPMIIERLRREITRSNMARNVQVPGQTPRQMMLGPMVMLINQYSASDGDLFPYAFKKHEMGTIIGVRTWGGVVGIRGSLPFMDGMDLRKPEFASYSAETSDWIIEGIGVEPDIVVDNDPAREYKGEDTQLDKAIEIILEELKDYKPVPPIPDGPDKSK